MQTQAICPVFLPIILHIPYVVYLLVHVYKVRILLGAKRYNIIHHVQEVISESGGG
jgi:hypothetical protein